MGVALPIIAIGATVIGAAVSAYGMVSSGITNQRVAEYQAQVANNNAIIAKQNAEYATAAGNAKAQQQEMATRAAIGNQMAAQASSGLDVNSGSAVDVRSSTAALGTISELNIRNNAAREAYGFTQQGQDFTAEAGLDKAKGSAALTTGIVGGVGTLISGAGKTYDMVSNMQRTGALMSNPPDIVR